MGVLFSRTADGGVTCIPIKGADWWRAPFPDSTAWSNNTWSNSTNANKCVLLGVKDELFYWPTPAGPNAATTVVYNDQYTFTSPSVYMHWATILAHDYSNLRPGGDPGNLGSPIYDTIIAYDPGEVSSITLGWKSSVLAGWPSDEPLDDAWLPMTFSDFNMCNSGTWRTPITSTMTLTGFDGVVNHTTIIRDFEMTRTVTHQGQEVVISNDPCNPYLNWPIKMWSIKSEWSQCRAYGVVDPPVVLKPQAILVPPPTTTIQPLTQTVTSASTRANAFSSFSEMPQPTAPPRASTSSDTAGNQPQGNEGATTLDLNSNQSDTPNNIPDGNSNVPGGGSNVPDGNQTGPDDSSNVPDSNSNDSTNDNLNGASSSNPDGPSNDNLSTESSDLSDQSDSLQLEQTSDSGNINTELIIPSLKMPPVFPGSTPDASYDPSLLLTRSGSNTVTEESSPTDVNVSEYIQDGQGQGSDSRTPDLGDVIASVMGDTASQTPGSSGLIALSTEAVTISSTTRNNISMETGTPGNLVATGAAVTFSQALDICWLLECAGVLGLLVQLM